MAFRKLLQRLTTSDAELDRERLRQFCHDVPGVTPIGEAKPRQEVTVAGGDLLAAHRAPGGHAVARGHRQGRQRLAGGRVDRPAQHPGVAPGKRLVLSGRGTAQGPGGRLTVLNPRYELL